MTVFWNEEDKIRDADLRLSAPRRMETHEVLHPETNRVWGRLYEVPEPWTPEEYAEVRKVCEQHRFRKIVVPIEDDPLLREIYQLGKKAGQEGR